jgi:hypothetical protein
MEKLAMNELYPLLWSSLRVTPEQAFAMAIARTYGLAVSQGASIAEMSAIAREISSWSHVSHLLRFHRLNSVAYQLFGTPEFKAAGIVSDSFLDERRRAYQRSFAKAVLEPAVLHKTVSALTEAGSRAFLIKGLAVGTWLYGDTALREHADLDLLIPADQLDAADRVLTSLGFAVGYRPPLNPGEIPATIGYSDLAGVYAVDLSIDPLQVFWQSLPDRLESFDRWWSRRQMIAVGAREVPTLAAEDQLIHLARHLQFHGFFRLNWWVDLLVLLRVHGPNMDWSIVQAEANRHGIVGGLERTLSALESIFGASLPAPAHRAIRPGRMEQLLHRRIWPDELAVPDIRTGKGQEGTPIAPRFLSPAGVHPLAGLALFLLDRRRKDYVRFLVQRIVPPRSWLRESYGLNGSYLNLIWRHIRALRAHRSFVRTKRKQSISQVQRSKS